MRLAHPVFCYNSDTDEQTGIDYSDGTADIAFTYDRLGRTKNVIDAVGTRTFVYDGNTLQLTSESITGLYERTITRTYETAGVRGRSTGFYLGIGEYGVTYGYDSDTGRFGSVAWNIGGASGTAACSYVENSDLLHKLTSADGNLKTTYTYEDKRNLRTQVKNEYGTNLISQYDYEYDEIGRRRSVKNTGSAFTAAAFNLYNYNDRSELTGSHRYEGTDIGNPGDPLGSETRIYAYDPIGSRKSATEGSTDISYVSNGLNQYTAISGISPAYDDDGNMLSDAERNYTWNAENRLVLEEPVNPADGKKAEFLYDYMGRRVRKTVFAYAAGTWTQESEKLFVYDGWNLIEEIADQGGAESSKYYVWGLDLSQSLQGAGGIGGLICSVDNLENTLYYLYDANGNVGQLVAEDGGIMARYEYDPFGNGIVGSGDAAAENPFRFSTKYYDAETGLYYYGFRYYSPKLGRWTNRDPIEELGGINLYVFIANNAINGTDLYGLLKDSATEELLRILSEVTEEAIEREGKKSLIKRLLPTLSRIASGLGIPVAVLIEELILPNEVGVGSDVLPPVDEDKDDDDVTVYHGSFNNFNEIITIGLNTNRLPAYVSTDVAVAFDAIYKRYDWEFASEKEKCNSGVIASKIPGREWNSLITFGSIRLRTDYKGFSRTLDTVEYQLKDHLAIKAFNDRRFPFFKFTGE